MRVNIELLYFLASWALVSYKTVCFIKVFVSFCVHQFLQFGHNYCPPWKNFCLLLSVDFKTISSGNGGLRFCLPCKGIRCPLKTGFTYIVSGLLACMVKILLGAIRKVCHSPRGVGGWPKWWKSVTKGGLNQRVMSLLQKDIVSEIALYILDFLIITISLTFWYYILCRKYAHLSKYGT